MVASLSSEAAGLRSEFFKPSGKPSTSRISLLRQGKARCALSFITLAFSSPEVRGIALTLHSAHLFRGRAERRDCFLRRLRSFLTPALRAQTRTAESLRKAPLPVMPGLDAPGTSARPLRQRVLRRGCRALRSRHPELLRPLRLHYLTQVPSAGPALTCEDG